MWLHLIDCCCVSSLVSWNKVSALVLLIDQEWTIDVFEVGNLRVALKMRLVDRAFKWCHSRIVLVLNIRSPVFLEAIATSQYVTICLNKLTKLWTLIPSKASCHFSEVLSHYWVRISFSFCFVFKHRFKFRFVKKLWLDLWLKGVVIELEYFCVCSRWRDSVESTIPDSPASIDVLRPIRSYYS